MLSAVLALLSLVLATEPDLEELMRAGRDAMSRGDFTGAEKVFEEAVALEPDSPRASYYLGLARLRQGRARDSIPSLERARSLSSQPNAAVLFELGTAYIQTEDYPRAASVLRSASELVPNEARFRLQLAWAYYKMLQGVEAQSELRIALKNDPNNPVVHFYMGLVLAAVAELEQAASFFQRTIELDPNRAAGTASVEADARLGLARVLSQSGQDAEATRELELVLQKFEDRAAPAHNELGLIALRASDWESATRHFEAVAAVDPKHRQAAYNLALLYRRQGKEELASEMQRRFEALTSEDASEQHRSLSRTSSKKRR